MDKLSKKELRDNYINRTAIGGVYYIKCNGSGHMWLKSTTDMPGQRNRYNYTVVTNTCPEPGMLKDWNQYGAESFSFTVLEEIKKGETQTDREFADDIRVLLDIWKEKQQP